MATKCVEAVLGGSHDEFKEQRLRGLCTPVCTPRTRCLVFLVLAVVFTMIGLWLLTGSVTEHELQYPERGPSGTGALETLEFSLPEAMEPPIYIYYQLENFHQNHRQYLESVDPKQLLQAENPRTEGHALPKCKPWVAEEQGLVNYPCGLVARSVFNDSFVVLQKGPTDKDWSRLPVDSSAAAIAWPTDRDGRKFRNVDPEAEHGGGKQNQELLNMWLLEQFPPVTCEQTNFSDGKAFVPTRVATRKVGDRGAEVADCTGYNSSEPSCNFTRGDDPFNCSGDPDYELVRQRDWGVESGHFMVWMRIAGLESFRKLWGNVDRRLEANTRLRIHVTDNFEVSSFSGRKKLVITTSSALGGGGKKLSFGYLGAGILCLALMACSALKRRSPRIRRDTLLENEVYGDDGA